MKDQYKEASLKEIIEQLEFCQYECEAGKLSTNIAFLELKRRSAEMVTITKSEYRILLGREEFLECLEACGVDNWFGYSDAYEMYKKEK